MGKGAGDEGIAAHLTRKMREDGLSWPKVFLAAFVSAFFLIVADYCYFLALSMTSAGIPLARRFTCVVVCVACVACVV
jgi:phosphoglycerol transferase MdoB-like AlkP superfamily enzyme